MAKLCEGILAMAPCIVFVDEIDKIMPSGDDSTGVSDEILGQFQTFVSDIPRGMGFFVGTTNYPRRIPRALLRPGRFEEVIPMLPQHLDGLRHEALPIIAKSMGQIISKGVDWVKIATKCIDYTGADLGNLLIKANKISVMAGKESIHQKHLEEAVQNIVPTVAETQLMMDEALRFCSDKSYVPTGLQGRVGKGDIGEIDDDRSTARRVPQL
jgi:SpoVK/Ycf46/Vps4 family AAA+-type ATPase